MGKEFRSQSRTWTLILIDDTQSEMTGMTENETSVIEVAIEKAPEAREKTETTVEDERIVISDMIVRVLETEAREETGTIVVDEMIGIKDEIDAIEETLRWKDLALPDEMIAETREE